MVMEKFNGTYGTRKAANITADDCDIYYYYRPSRSSESVDFKGFRKLDSNLLKQVNLHETGERLPGIYNLRLPISEFSEKGFYCVYITPKAVSGITIADVGSLYGYPNIRGVVIDSATNYASNSLVGYRVEYLDEEGEVLDYERIITSNNYCEPMYVASSDNATGGVSYKLNPNGSLIFCTLTPSLAMSFNAGNEPFIGEKGQMVRLVNTKFNPVMLEIELVDDDIESLSTMLKGKQIRNLDKSLITTFDGEGGIYHQALFGTITDSEGGLHHEFRLPLEDSVDASELDNLETIEMNV